MLIAEATWLVLSIIGASAMIAWAERGPIAAARGWLLRSLAMGRMRWDTLDAIAHGLRCAMCVSVWVGVPASVAAAHLTGDWWLLLAWAPAAAVLLAWGDLRGAAAGDGARRSVSTLMQDETTNVNRAGDVRNAGRDREVEA